MKYEALYTLTKTQGGATIRLKDYPEQIVMPKKGYAVAQGSDGVAFGLAGIPEVDEKAFDRTIEWALLEFPVLDFEYLGTWLNDDIMYIDPVYVFASKDFALGVAFGTGEKAIYDLAKGKEITIKRKKAAE